MLHLLCAVLYFRLTTVESSGKVTYDNYRVYRVSPSNDEQMKVLQLLEEKGNYDFWTSPSLMKPVDIMVSRQEAENFTNMMRHHGIPSEIHIPNVQRLLDEERGPIREKSSKVQVDWTDYYDLETIYKWLSNLINSNPGKVTAQVAGRSFEGRDIAGIKVSHSRKKPAVFIEGGIHAREWISHATVSYMLNELVTSKDPAVQKLTKEFDFYVFPCVNPDGYVYTHETDRMWRKTRSKYNDSKCIGTDPNRNWDFHWKEKGTSGSPCTDTYGGREAFSEIETRSLSQYMTGLKKSLCLFVSYHSYSQFLLLPYGHTKERPRNYKELMSIGKKALAALTKVNGTHYLLGSVIDIIYPASGATMDWVYGVLGVPYSYTYELRDTGEHGFVIPPEMIKIICKETFASLVAMLKNIKCRNRKS